MLSPAALAFQAESDDSKRRDLEAFREYVYKPCNVLQKNKQIQIRIGVFWTSFDQISSARTSLKLCIYANANISFVHSLDVFCKVSYLILLFSKQEIDEIQILFDNSFHSDILQKTCFLCTEFLPEILNMIFVWTFFLQVKFSVEISISMSTKLAWLWKGTLKISDSYTF